MEIKNGNNLEKSNTWKNKDKKREKSHAKTVTGKLRSVVTSPFSKPLLEESE